ncbi:MAG: DEAD/DEAH box helicase family protein [Rhodobacterales bacterium]|nr:DEAD/DEAH box helicase family protein [Rhodobacterales bacterium]
MIRWDDQERTIKLSVRDLVEQGAPSGHLALEVVQTRTARMAAGRLAHVTWQTERSTEDALCEAEVSVKVQLEVDGWTAIMQGRVDGLTKEEGRPIVEEVKSTTLDGGSLYSTQVDDWPRYAAQLEVYLWMLANNGWDRPAGRLVFLSLADGARHVLGVALDGDRVGEFIRSRLAWLILARERRIEWMAYRRALQVPQPHDTWRPGQQEIAEATEWALEAGNSVLVQAPTGLGKTAPVLMGVLRYALKHNKQVFWATARTTQQTVIRAALDRFAQRGLSLRAVGMHAKEKLCLNDVVACRPDLCTHAELYYDKVQKHDLVGTLAHSQRRIDKAELLSEGARCQVCPRQLALDLSEHVDVVIGDYNYAFDPSVQLRRHFGDTAGDWVVVVDEVHQLVERARGWGSPKITLKLALDAADQLDAAPPDYRPFAHLARQIAVEVEEAVDEALGRSRGDEIVANLPDDFLEQAARRIDDVGLEYALLKARRPIMPPGEPDPWQDLARAVLRFRGAFTDRGDETVSIANIGRGKEAVALLCLDPARLLGEKIARLGGLAGCSATLRPGHFFQEMLGLNPEKLDWVNLETAFEPGNRKVIIAPRISTAYRDRVAHAPATADLLQDCIRAINGNVAVYFSSFAMLRDLSERWDLPNHELLRQHSGMTDTERQDWLDRLATPGRPVVLAAVLGGIFAEGIDLPPGALSGVLVTGPALPPVGLERDLLQEWYEERYGQGFLYASLIPGMTRVVQAAGRLIRRAEDRGVIVLVGRRFRWRDIANLLPSDWDPEVADDPAAAVSAFGAQS